MCVCVCVATGDAMQCKRSMNFSTPSNAYKDKK